MGLFSSFIETLHVLQVTLLSGSHSVLDDVLKDDVEYEACLTNYSTRGQTSAPAKDQTSWPGTMFSSNPVLVGTLSRICHAHLIGWWVQAGARPRELRVGSLGVPCKPCRGDPVRRAILGLGGDGRLPRRAAIGGECQSSLGAGQRPSGVVECSRLAARPKSRGSL